MGLNETRLTCVLTGLAENTVSANMNIANIKIEVLLKNLKLF